MRGAAVKAALSLKPSEQQVRSDIDLAPSGRVKRHRVHLPPARREVDGAAVDHQHLRRGLGPASSKLSDPKRGVELASVPLRRVEWTGCDLERTPRCDSALMPCRGAEKTDPCQGISNPSSPNARALTRA